MQQQILKQTEPFYSQDKKAICRISLVEYVTDDGKKYPKLRLTVCKQTEDGFPADKAKSLNIPLDLREILSKQLLAFKL
jgi:hypothetical protein